MATLPPNHQQAFDEIIAAASRIDGWMTQRELKFLTLLAACPTAEGELLEIGSFVGRSTVAIAKAARLAGCAPVVAVDPQLPQGIRERFDANLAAAGVTELVEFHQCLSWDLGESWDRPLRALWIDGCHQYEAAKRDFDVFSPHLVDGAIVALHDVLNHFDGSIRVFLEDVLLSDHFAAAGVCGSIGWAQYRQDASHGQARRASKLRLYRALSPLVPLVAFDRKPRGLSALKFRLLRSRVPRRTPRAEDWVRRVA